MSSKETGIWDDEDLKKEHKHDKKLVRSIAGMFNPMKVADLGCGDGWYSHYFKQICGWPIVHGYEGNVKQLAKEAFHDDIMIVDLSKIKYIDIYYDLVVCLEVGEHIPKKHEQKFLDNVERFTSKDLVLSWAVPGQDGRGHYNEQPNEYIIKEMAKRGFAYNREKSQILRKDTTYEWFENTVMVFEKV